MGVIIREGVSRMANVRRGVVFYHNGNLDIQHFHHWTASTAIHSIDETSCYSMQLDLIQYLGLKIGGFCGPIEPNINTLSRFGHRVSRRRIGYNRDARIGFQWTVQLL